ncbi:hypothetical protein ACH4PU_32260 [Streptomyces sp. NPDC021100]|uniref:hypothetical protein n=1 Tax=Streptomyces sp. NPDC021100 TaxID=3365114 RepID=UPI0037905110
MTRTLAQLQEWQGAGGPAQWQAAWTRAIALLRPVLEVGEGPYSGGDGEWADGGAALATALYILAREHDITVDQVTRAQVEELLRRRAGESDTGVAARWEAHIRALGHDLGDRDDPVSVRWQALAIDNSPSEEGYLPEDVYADSTHRWGPAAVEGLNRVLAPAWREYLLLE